MSDTPRTDAWVQEYNRAGGNPPTIIEFMRQLERELNQSRGPSREVMKSAEAVLCIGEQPCPDCRRVWDFLRQSSANKE